MTSPPPRCQAPLGLCSSPRSFHSSAPCHLSRKGQLLREDVSSGGAETREPGLLVRPPNPAQPWHEIHRRVGSVGERSHPSSAHFPPLRFTALVGAGGAFPRSLQFCVHPLAAGSPLLPCSHPSWEPVGLTSVASFCNLPTPFGCTLTSCFDLGASPPFLSHDSIEPRSWM